MGEVIPSFETARAQFKDGQLKIEDFLKLQECAEILKKPSEEEKKDIKKTVDRLKELLEKKKNEPLTREEQEELSVETMLLFFFLGSHIGSYIIENYGDLIDKLLENFEFPNDSLKSILEATKKRIQRCKELYPPETKIGKID